MKIIYKCSIALVLIITHANAQSQIAALPGKDTIPSQSLDSVTIIAYLRQSTIKSLPDIQGTYIFAGRKTEMINLKQTDVNLSDKTGRKPLYIEDHFPLFGGSLSYKPKEKLEVYGGWSQAYHPMVFKDLIPTSVYEVDDPNIKDAEGYNAEAGFKGSWKFLKWDVTAYILQLNNRFGTLAQTDNTGNLILYRTNIGNSTTRGMEIFVQGDWMLSNITGLSVFTSTAFMHARYTDVVVKSGNTNVEI
ncbi:MAG: TonB-dependent receptor [Chitinophagaceae bacterium]